MILVYSLRLPSILAYNRILQLSMAQRKTERGKVPILAFQMAATDIRGNKLSIRKGAEKHGIDRMTLKRYLEKVAKDGTE